MKSRELQPCYGCGVLGARKCIFCLAHTCVRHGVETTMGWACSKCRPDYALRP